MDRPSPESRQTSYHSESEALRKKLETATHNEERIRILLALAASLRRQKPFDALDYALSALRLSRSSGNAALTADSLCLIGHIQGVVGKHASALDNLREAHHLFRQMRNEEKEHEALFLIAEVHNHLGHHDEALRLHTRNLEYFRSSGHTLWIIRTLSNMGLIRKTQTEHAEAITLFLEAIDLAEREDLPKELCRLYNNIALAFRQIGDLDRAIPYFQTAIRLYDRIGDHLGSAIAHSNLGSTHLRRDHFTPALNHLTRALRVFHRLGHAGREANAWNGLGSAFLDMGNPEKAERCLLKSLEILQQIEPTHFHISLYRNLAILYEAKGEHLLGVEFGEKGMKAAEEQNDPLWQSECADILSILYENLGNLSEALRYAILHQEGRRNVFAAQKIQDAIEVAMHARIAELQKEFLQKEEDLQKLRDTLERKDITLSTMALQLLQKQSSNDKPKGNVKTSDSSSSPEHPDMDSIWGQLVGQISKVDQRFYRQLARIYPQLTATERKVCTLIRIGLVSKEIATLLGISVRTVEVHRTNIRKKLDIPQATALNSFISSL